MLSSNLCSRSMHQSFRKLIKCFSSYIDPTLEHDLLSPTKPWALSPLICTMPHFMHTRVPAADSFNNTAIARQVGNNSTSCYLPPFPPTQSIRDSTDDLYLTVVQGPDFSDSSSSSSVSPVVPKPITWSSSSGVNDVVKKAVERRSINVEGDVQRFEGAGQRRSYFNSASRRELIQFGPEVCPVTDRTRMLNLMKYVGRDNNGFLLWIY